MKLLPRNGSRRPTTKLWSRERLGAISISCAISALSCEISHNERMHLGVREDGFACQSDIKHKVITPKIYTLEPKNDLQMCNRWRCACLQL